MPLANRSFLARNWTTFLVAGTVLAFVVALGAVFFLRGRMMMEQELKTRLQTTAAVAADRFTKLPIDAIRSPDEMHTPAYRSIVAQLQEIRSRIPSVLFVYIMRRTDDPLMLSFVADADSLATPEELDENGNGIVEPEEEASYPGDLYEINDIPALQGPAFEGPAVDSEITYDQWGALMSGYAPIRDESGNIIAVLGIDMSADAFLALASSIFSPVAFLLVVFAGFLIAVYVYWTVSQRRIEATRQIEEERSSLLQLTLHRLGTPLTIFQWSIEMLDECEKNHDCSAENIRSHINQMREGLKHMEQIIGALLKVDKLMSNRVRYTPEQASLCDIIESVHALLRPQLEQRKQILDRSCTGDMRLALDRELIAGVLQELMQNAMTYSPDGSTISITARRHYGRVQVDVTDKGAGIPAADLPRVFSKFARGSNASKYRPDGNGLGLFIAKEVIERAGGRMQLVSDEGKGTTVSFTLPVS